ncbi:hypothetical protein HC928_15100, partial [bacterium]|nr:hypothetical protein [bacterium]
RSTAPAPGIQPIAVGWLLEAMSRAGSTDIGEGLIPPQHHVVHNVHVLPEQYRLADQIASKLIQAASADAFTPNAGKRLWGDWATPNRSRQLHVGHGERSYGWSLGCGTSSYGSSDC